MSSLLDNCLIIVCTGFALASYAMVSINILHYILINNYKHQAILDERFQYHIAIINVSFWMIMYYFNILICMHIINSINIINRLSVRHIICIICMFFHYIYGMTGIICYMYIRNMYESNYIYITSYADSYILYLFIISYLIFVCGYIAINYNQN